MISITYEDDLVGCDIDGGQYDLHSEGVLTLGCICCDFAGDTWLRICK